MTTLDLSPLIYDETEEWHLTDYPGSVDCLFMARHLYYQAEGSTTMTVGKN